MVNFIRSEGEVDRIYTSGAGIFPIGGGAGTVLVDIIWEHNGLASGVSVSILDTISGTAASGLWLAVSGVTSVSVDSPKFASGMNGVGANSVPMQLFYNQVMNSGLAIVISGGAANVVRANIGYVSGQA